MKYWRVRFCNIMTSSALVSSCSSSARELCEVDIASKLINPETAEYFDFTQADEAEFREGFEHMIWREKNILPQDRYKYGDQLKASIDEAMMMLRSTNPDFHLVRVKADSRMGLNITSSYVCASAKKCDTATETCTCVDADLS